MWRTYNITLHCNEMLTSLNVPSDRDGIARHLLGGARNAAAATEIYITRSILILCPDFT